jgi:hypothetical protein
MDPMVGGERSVHACCEHCLRLRPMGELVRVIDRLGQQPSFLICRPSIDLASGGCFRRAVGGSRYAISLAQPPGQAAPDSQHAHS